MAKIDAHGIEKMRQTAHDMAINAVNWARFLEEHGQGPVAIIQMKFGRIAVEAKGILPLLDEAEGLVGRGPGEAKLA